MIVNSFIVFQEYRKEFPDQFQNFSFGQLELRESIVKSLLGTDNWNDQNTDFTLCMPAFDTKRQRCSF